MKPGPVLRPVSAACEVPFSFKVSAICPYQPKSPWHNPGVPSFRAERGIPPLSQRRGIPHPAKPGFGSPRTFSVNRTPALRGEESLFVEKGEGFLAPLGMTGRLGYARGF